MAGTMNLHVLGPDRNYYVSMESGLDGRNNEGCINRIQDAHERSQWSPA